MNGRGLANHARGFCIAFRMLSQTHGARVAVLPWALKSPTARNRYHFLAAFSADVSRARFTMPNLRDTGRRSDSLTRLTRGLAMKLMVVMSSSVFAGIARANRRSMSSDCRATGGRRMWMKDTKGEVVYATKTRGMMAESVAVAGVSIRKGLNGIG